jgi:signal transduction histidine kinase
VDNARNSQTGGTGLGLAITKTIIEKHTGHISLVTETGKGCKFIIELNS